MDFAFSPQEKRFRLQVREWLAENLPDGWGTPAFRQPQGGAEQMAFGRAWLSKLHEGGWSGLTWPVEYGGRGASRIEALIYNEEYARARAPSMMHLAVGTTLVGPTLMQWGTHAQKQRFLRRILTGEEIWCQGFSEPGSGSDLASLRTRAEIEGDELVVTGQKIWTSFARYADWCILLVRTNAQAPKHEGISFVLCDMRTKGIEIRPLVEITGEAWFNQVFFDRARIPLENVVGAVDEGWKVVITTLAHERHSAAPHAGLGADLELLLERVRRPGPDGRRPGDDPLVRQELARIATEIATLRATAYRNLGALERTGQPGPEGSIGKVVWTELDQRLRAAALRILGPYGLLERGDPLAVDGGLWSHQYLWSRAHTIYAGTSEIQRNIVAERVLGLPR